MKPVAAFFWRRLDRPGLDSCRLFRLANGWRLAGMAVFHEAGANHLAYEVDTDPDWRTRAARVQGWHGHRPVDVRIRAGRRGWTCDGQVLAHLCGCIDLDLGFTPSTNLIAVRRLGLALGAAGDSRAAYLEFPRLRMTVLPQTYRRSGRFVYRYEAPTAGYRGSLLVDRHGAVVRYPGVFERCIPARAPRPGGRQRVT